MVFSVTYYFKRRTFWHGLLRTIVLSFTLSSTWLFQQPFENAAISRILLISMIRMTTEYYISAANQICTVGDKQNDHRVLHLRGQINTVGDKYTWLILYFFKQHYTKTSKHYYALYILRQHHKTCQIGIAYLVCVVWLLSTLCTDRMFYYRTIWTSLPYKHPDRSVEESAVRLDISGHPYTLKELVYMYDVAFHIIYNWKTAVEFC
jgi:hypothetical protein